MNFDIIFLLQSIHGGSQREVLQNRRGIAVSRIIAGNSATALNTIEALSWLRRYRSCWAFNT